MMEEEVCPSETQSVLAEVHPLVSELTGKETARTALEGTFSVYHSSAGGLVYGEAIKEKYEDQVVLRLEIVAVRDLIQVEINHSLEADQSKVTIVLKGDEKITENVELAVGSLQVSLRDDMLREKFIEQFTPVTGGKTQAASRSCWAFAEPGDVAELATFI